MVVPAFAFCAWAELCLHLHEAPRILTDADLVEWIPLGDHSPVRRVELRLFLLLRVQGSSKGLDLDLSCVSAIASHVELHLWIDIEFLAIGLECILCGSCGELVDPSIPWNNFSPCLALII